MFARMTISHSCKAEEQRTCQELEVQSLDLERFGILKGGTLFFALTAISTAKMQRVFSDLGLKWSFLVAIELQKLAHSQ